ncbi:MAG: transposase [Candidatus Aminicenantes bacterium]|nr:MAG: transposase [Candidatus Aminicenantes bacterium]
MARQKRLKVKGERAAYYHIMSRTVGQEFYLGDVEKEKLFNIIQYYSGFYFVKVLGLSLLNNHFHLLIKSEPQSYYNDDEIMQRIKRYILDKDHNKKEKRKGKKNKRVEEEQEQEQLQLHEEYEEEDEDEEISPDQLLRIKNKMEDISEYVRAIKQEVPFGHICLRLRRGAHSDIFKLQKVEKKIFVCKHPILNRFEN